MEESPNPTERPRFTWPPGPTNVGAIDFAAVDPCVLVSPADIAHLIGATVKDGVVNAASASERQRWCKFDLAEERGGVTVGVDPNLYDQAHWQKALDSLVAKGAIRRDDLSRAGWQQSWTVDWESEFLGLRVGQTATIFPEVVLSVELAREATDDDCLLANAWSVLARVVAAWEIAVVPRVTPEPTIAPATGPCDPRLSELVAHVTDRLAQWRDDAVHAAGITNTWVALVYVGHKQDLEGEVAWLTRNVPENPGFWPGIDAYAAWVAGEDAWWASAFDDGTATDADLAARFADILDTRGIEAAVRADLASCST